MPKKKSFAMVASESLDKLDVLKVKAGKAIKGALSSKNGLLGKEKLTKFKKLKL